MYIFFFAHTIANKTIDQEEGGEKDSCVEPGEGDQEPAQSEDSRTPIWSQLLQAYINVNQNRIWTSSEPI